MPEASFPVQVISGVSVVVAPEEIDMGNADELRTALLEAAAHGNGTLAVDMTGTRFCDSAGINALVRAHKRAQTEGGGLLLAACTSPVLRIFEITGLDHAIPSFTTLEEALAQAASVTGSPALPEG